MNQNFSQRYCKSNDTHALNRAKLWWIISPLSLEYPGPQHMFWLRKKKIIFNHPRLVLSRGLIAQLVDPDIMLPCIVSFSKTRTLSALFSIGSTREHCKNCFVCLIWFFMSHQQSRPLVKECVTEKYFSYFSTNHMLWVLKRTVSMRRFFWAPKTYVKLMGKKIFTILISKILFI